MTGADDQWTLVKHKRHGRTSKTVQKGKGEKAQKNATVAQGHGAVPSSSSSNDIDQRELDKCLKTIAAFRMNWSTSSQGRHLRKTLLALRNTISNAIVVGLGNLDPDSIRDRFRAIWQLAVFLEIVKAFEGSTRAYEQVEAKTENRLSQMPLLAQDPAFTPFDKALLSLHGIEVRPDAMQSCSSQTFLFVPFVDAVVLLPDILQDRDPELYVGTDITLVVEKMRVPTYAQMGHISQDLVDKSLEIAQNFLRCRQKLVVDFNGSGELSLYGLSMYGRAAHDAVEN